MRAVPYGDEKRYIIINDCRSLSLRWHPISQVTRLRSNELGAIFLAQGLGRVVAGNTANMIIDTLRPESPCLVRES